MDQPNVVTKPQEPWNKGKLVGQKAPFKLKEIFTTRLAPIRPVEGAWFETGSSTGLRRAGVPPWLQRGFTTLGRTRT